MANANLRVAQKAKSDEFYTTLSDIEKELRHYKGFFKGKVVYCNCDDARESNFFKYFSLNFEHLGLKKLISTGFKADGKGVVLIYEGDKNGNRKVDNEEIVVNELQGNGDFRSAECIEFLKECDIVVTNPPFSLFREYVAQLMEYSKKFLIIGNMNAITYKEIFTLIKNNEIWAGYGFNMSMVYKTPYENTLEANRKFVQSKGYDPNENYIKVPAINWYTNIPHNKRNETLDLYRKYDADAYPKYDNYDAIEVSKVSEIPMDYEGIMGVPITFLDKYCPTQFEILGLAADKRDNNEIFIKGSETYLDERHKRFVGMVLKGKATYARILIRNLAN